MNATVKYNGEVVLENVDVTFDPAPGESSEPTDWRGTILLAEGEYMDPGHYDLELENGDSGQIIITYTPSTPGPMRIYFRGTGRPR